MTSNSYRLHMMIPMEGETILVKCASVIWWGEDGFSIIINEYL